MHTYLVLLIVVTGNMLQGYDVSCFKGLVSATNERHAIEQAFVQTSVVNPTITFTMDKGFDPTIRSERVLMYGHYDGEDQCISPMGEDGDDPP